MILSRTSPQTLVLLAAGLASLALQPLAAAQVCAGDIQLTTQAEVDAFACAEVQGDLAVGPSTDIANLDSLSELASVGKSLLIFKNTALKSVAGLASLTSAAHLSVEDNDALTNIDGLPALSSVGTLFITGNEALTDIDGFSALTDVGVDLYIVDNASLTNLDGLSALTSIRWQLYVALTTR